MPNTEPKPPEQKLPEKPHEKPMSRAEVIVPEYDGQEWTDLDSDKIKELFKEHGAILFRGFKGDVDRIAAFSDNFCDSYMINPNADRGPVDPEKQIETVPPGDHFFELHTERHQTPPTPDICWFYCNEAPVINGETTFCDGELLVSVFSDEMRELLSQKNLWYFNLTSLANVQSILGAKDLEDLQQILIERKLDKIYRIHGDEIMQTYITPVLRTSRYRDNQTFANFLLFSRYNYGHKEYPTFQKQEPVSDEICEEIRSTAAQITVFHKWQKSDLVMLDNTRFMHGRNKVDTSKPRDIWTRFGYASF